MRTPSPAARRWSYRVFVAAVPLLVVYGVVGEHEAPLWIVLGASVLVGGMADANVPAAPDAQADDGPDHRAP